MKRDKASAFLGVAAAIACFASPTAAQSGTRSMSARTSSPTGPSASSQGVAVVELFTSQGCSSCPPADAALRQIASIAKQTSVPVYVLSFHVDYWNRLGWKDPYSDVAYSNRQKAYAKAAGSRRVYTPQMVVSGRTEFVGSDKEKARQAITSALKKKAQTQIQLQVAPLTSGDTVVIQFQIEGDSQGHHLNVAVVETPAANVVPRGENAGRQLAHVNVVRTFQTVELDGASGQVDLKLPRDIDFENARVIAYIQNTKSLAVSGATSIAIGT